MPHVEMHRAGRFIPDLVRELNRLLRNPGSVGRGGSARKEDIVEGADPGWPRYTAPLRFAATAKLC